MRQSGLDPRDRSHVITRPSFCNTHDWSTKSQVPRTNNIYVWHAPNSTVNEGHERNFSSLIQQSNSLANWYITRYAKSQTPKPKDPRYQIPSSISPHIHLTHDDDASCASDPHSRDQPHPANRQSHQEYAARAHNTQPTLHSRQDS
jgi:hypothetical protein